MNFDDFLKKLWEQNPAGEKGFEGLIAKLLEYVTEQRFYLSASGRQEGRDIASNSLMAECKRYDDSTSLKSDELLAKFSAAILTAPPDLWLVVTTKRLKEQIHNQLKSASQKCGTAYFSIDAQNNEKSTLMALCATNPKIVSEHLQKYGTSPLLSNDAQALETYLNTLAQDTIVQKNIEKLRKELAIENIGYEDCCKKQNAWLSECLQKTDESKAFFTQDIAIKAQGKMLIPRQEAEKAIFSWIKQWHEHHQPLVILGEEGDGKTWAVASVFYSSLEKPSTPPILFIPSAQVNSTEPERLIIEALKYSLKEPYSGYWDKRLTCWLACPSVKKPYFLLILDGLNERHDIEWQHLLAKLKIEPWCNHVAVLMTCRNVFWQERLAPHISDIQTWQLNPYSDSELDQALIATKLTRNDFNADLIELLRIPRYFDLAIRLRKQMSSDGEITKERLIYEDWRDKLGRKLNKSLSHDEFQELITNLSEIIKQKKAFSRQELDAELNTYSQDKKALFNELSSAKILEKKSGNKWTLNHNNLILGFGLLLANEISELDSEDRINEIIASYQEPQSDMDIKVAICAMALYHALGEANLSNVFCLALFKAWITGRNITDEDWSRVTAYIPLRPEIYLQMVEWLWSERTNNMGMQDAFMAGFLKFKDSQQIQTALKPAFERWMGFVYPDGHAGRYADENQETKRLESRQKVAEALGQEPVGIIELFGYRLNIIQDQGLLRLSRFVLALISHQPRTPYLHAIVTGVVAGTVMGSPSFQEQLAWVLHTAMDDDVEQSLLSAAQSLIQEQIPTAQKAAWWLLSALDTERAIYLYNKIPQKYHFKSSFRQWYEDNPCEFRLWSWTQENYLKCLEKTQFNPSDIARMLKHVALNPKCTVPDWLPSKLSSVGEHINLTEVRSKGFSQTSEDIELEAIEIALCAYNPKKYAELINKLTKQLPERSLEAKKNLAWTIYDHILIMNEEARLAIDNAWDFMLEHTKKSDSNDYGEDIFFPCVLRGRSLQKQLTFLEKRGDRSSYFSDYPPFFQAISDNHKLNLVIEIISNLTTVKQRYKFLAELRDALKYLDESLLSYLPDFTDIDDTLSRKYALEIIARTENEQAIKTVLESNWEASSLANSFECYWGSIILAKYGNSLPFDKLLKRISITLLGYAVKERGFKPDEVLSYGEALHQLWCNINNLTFETPSEAMQVQIKTGLLNSGCEFNYKLDTEENCEFKLVSGDTVWGGGNSQNKRSISEFLNIDAQMQKSKKPLNNLDEFADEQRKQGNKFFLHSFNIDGLAEVIDAHPNYVKQWLDKGLEQSSNVIVRCRGFYEALCKILLNKQPEQGVQLFWKIYKGTCFQLMDEVTRIPLILFRLFEASNSILVRETCNTLIENARTDQELFKFVWLAQYCKKTDWLNNLISGYLQSKHEFYQAKGLYLLGFIDTFEAGKQLDDWIAEKPDSWIRDCAKYAKYIHERNQWAHHWFQRFLMHPDTLQAWAAFRLFLHCVDRRFWLWGMEMLQANDISYERIEHYQACLISIIEATKNNEEKELKLSEKLIDHNVKNDQLWPWMEKYLITPNKQ